MKLVKIGKTMIASLCIAATLAGAALPTMALSPAGYTSLAQLEEENEATTPEQVEAQINQIGPITLESATAIANAQGSYDSLPDEWKAMVSNYETLKLATEELEDLQVENLTEKLRKSLYKEHDDVENFDIYYWSKWPLSTQTTFILPYFCVKNDEIQPIRLIYTYYGGNWIFWDNIVYSVDGEVYKKYFNTASSQKVLKEIGSNYTTVWEVRDEIADPVEIEMLKKSVSAKKAVYRFKGSDSQYDYPMSSYQNDREAITKVLDAYESLMAVSPNVQKRVLENLESHKLGSKFVKIAY